MKTDLGIFELSFEFVTLFFPRSLLLSQSFHFASQVGFTLVMHSFLGGRLVPFTR